MIIWAIFSPMFHSSDATIRGHVVCSFLALAQQKHLDDLLREADVTPEWKALLRDLDRLQNLRLEHRGADWLVRTDAIRNAGTLFRHAHIAPPPAASSVTSAHKRLGSPSVVPCCLEFPPKLA
jgi:hypothetical protein